MGFCSKHIAYETCGCCVTLARFGTREKCCAAKTPCGDIGGLPDGVGS